jgi:hypothetical protein
MLASSFKRTAQSLGLSEAMAIRALWRTTGLSSAGATSAVRGMSSLSVNTSQAQPSARVTKEDGETTGSLDAGASPLKTLKSSLSRLKPSTVSAIIELQGRPYSVKLHDLIHLPYSKDMKLGDVIRCDRIRELSTPDFIWQGSPFVSVTHEKEQLEIAVEGVVLEHPWSPEKITIRKGRKVAKKIVKNRARYTSLLIRDIRVVSSSIEE